MFFITPVAVAFAEGASGKPSSSMLSFAPLVILFIIFYFFLIRPQQKKSKEHKEMLSKVAQGDNIVTTGGLYGRVTSVGEETLMVEVADKVRLKIARSAVSIRKPQG